MKIDWDKVRLIAAKRFENVIIACNNHDENVIRDLMESGLAWSSKEYMLEDDDMKLDEKGCFTYKGFVCQICDCYEWHKSTDEGAAFYVCRVAIYDNKIDGHDWIIIPYILRHMPSNIDTSEWKDFIHLLDKYITDDMIPVSYEAMGIFEHAVD